MKTGAAMDEIRNQDIPVSGLAIVDSAGEISGHSFFEIAGKIVRVHWSAEPTPDQAAKVYEILQANA